MKCEGTGSQGSRRRYVLLLLGPALSLAVSFGARAQSSEPAGETSPPTVASPAAPRPTPAKAPASTPGQKADPYVYSPPGSLGDAVRRTREQQKPAETEKKKSLGTITNESLKKPGQSSTAATTGKGGKAAAATPTPFHTPPPPFVERDNEGRTEADWKALVKGAKDRIAKSEERIRQLETETARLENDFYAWSDGNYRDRVIKPAWDKSREDLKKARTDLDAANQNWDNMQEVARKAGTPPGWLR